jgi:zinc/manganese transport system permease protein
MLEALGIMKWPLAACLLLPGILVYLGLHIVRREIIFVDLALAQMAALGTCLAVLLGLDVDGWGAYAWSLGFTLTGAAVFTLTRNADRRVPQEALIGITYVVAAAAGVLLLSRNPEGNEQLRRTLVGDVLLVQPAEIARAFALYAAVGIAHALFRRQFLMISFDPQEAMRRRLRVRLWDFLFYGLFGLVVTSFVHIGGVLLVFSYLIIPAVCAILLAESLRARLIVGWAVATLSGVVGLCGSFGFDLPTGAAIVCALGAALLAALAVARWRKPVTAADPAA